MKGPEAKDRSSDVDAQASTTVDAELEQSCKAIEDAKREGLISSIHVCTGSRSYSVGPGACFATTSSKHRRQPEEKEVMTGWCEWMLEWFFLFLKTGALEQPMC